MNFNIIQDKLNDKHHRIYLNKFEIGAIHSPWPNLKHIYSVYTTDDRTKILKFDTFEECVNYVKEYVNG